MSRFLPLIVDQSDWGHICVTGADRMRFLQGMCTANVTALALGERVWASILNPKGRVMSIVEIVRNDDDLLLHCDPSLTRKTIELLTHYAVMDDVAFEPITLAAHRVWREPSAVWQAPIVLAAPPTEPAEPAAIEARRIAAGMPRYGVDVSEDNFPFETLLGRYIDYGKGCYVGQEPVFRVHSKGQASHVLRGLLADGPTPLPPGAVVDHPARPKAGLVSSAVLSPELGSIALAWLHRTAWEPGATVTIGDRRAVVMELPFQ